MRNDTKYRTSKITAAGMLVNLILGLLKISTGIYGKSYSAVADGVHSLSDMVTDLAILIGVRFWSAPPDKNHPYGHGRIETVITFFIGIVLALAGAGIGYDSTLGIRDKYIERPGAIAFSGMILTIILKEILYRKTIRVGKELNSSSVIANAWHHRSDGFSSILALTAVSAAYFFQGMEFIDRIGGVLVSVMIIRVSCRIVFSAFKELIDAGACQKDIDQIKSIVSEIDGVKDVHEVRSRQYNSDKYIDLHVLVDDNITVREGHEIAEKARNELMDKGPSIADAVVHIEPYRNHKSGDKN